MWEGNTLLLQTLPAIPGGHPPDAPGTARSIVQLIPDPVGTVDSFCAFAYVQSTTHMATHQLSFCTVCAILPLPWLTDVSKAVRSNYVCDCVANCAVGETRVRVLLSIKAAIPPLLSSRWMSV
jgi:hypothetical protein